MNTSHTPAITSSSNSDSIFPKIGIVTVTYNSSEVLDDFLRSLDHQTYRNFILIAIDNASTDDTLQKLRVRQIPSDIVISNIDNVGIATGNNQGIQLALEAGCDYVLLLNNDVTFGPELITRLLQGLIEQRCDMVSPLMYYHDRPDVFWAAGGYFQPWLGYRCLHYGLDQKDTGQFNSVRRVQHAPACCILIHKTVFDVVGLMDDRYFVYNDDTDFTLRAWKHGVSLVCLPDAKLWHKVSSLTRKGSTFFVRYGTRNRAFFMGKYLGRGALFAIGLTYKAYFLLRLLLRKDDVALFKLKLSSWKEGASISKNWLPQSAAKVSS